MAVGVTSENACDVPSSRGDGTRNGSAMAARWQRDDDPPAGIFERPTLQIAKTGAVPRIGRLRPTADIQHVLDRARSALILPTSRSISTGLES